MPKTVKFWEHVSKKSMKNVYSTFWMVIWSASNVGQKNKEFSKKEEGIFKKTDLLQKFVENWAINAVTQKIGMSESVTVKKKSFMVSSQLLPMDPPQETPFDPLTGGAACLE